MAVINIEITPRLGPMGRPLVYEDDGLRRAPVKLTIPASQTYSTTDRCSLTHRGTKNFFELYGATRIKQVIMSAGFSCNNVNYGEFHAEWLEPTQKLVLGKAGNSGAAALDAGEVANGTALGTGTITAEATLYF